MILTCPSCATSYSVDAAKLGNAGRTVRCAACGERWTAKTETDLELTSDDPFVTPPAAAEAPLAEIPADKLPMAFRARAEKKETVREAVVTGVVWAGMAASLGVILLAGALFRVDVVRLFPRTSGAYAMVGMPVNPTGFVFEGVTAHPALKDGHNALVVSGTIRNVQDRTLAAPPVKVSVLDKAGKPVAARIAPIDLHKIAPGQSRKFSVAVLNPPATADDVEVVFAAVRAKPLKPGKAKPHLETALRGSHGAPPAPPVQAVDARPVPADSPYALPSPDHG